MFTKVCDESEPREGKYEVVAVNRTLMLVVWPSGGRPRAFQGMCPMPGSRWRMPVSTAGP